MAKRSKPLSKVAILLICVGECLRELFALRMLNLIWQRERKERDVSLDLEPVLLNSSVHWPEEPGVSRALSLNT